MKKKLVATLLPLSILCSMVTFSLADESIEIAMVTSDIDAEMDELFGTTVVKKDVLPDFEVIELSSEVSQIESVEPASIETTREDQFTLSLTENSITYTLSSSIATPTIELRSIKGVVLASVHHSESDSNGTFDTDDLDPGYYIVRIVDGNGNSQHGAYAVAVN